MRSDDKGRTWSAAAVVPNYDWSGVECAGLTPLKSGRVLLNQWRFDWLPLPLAEASGRRAVRPDRLFAGLAVSPELASFGASVASAPAKAFPWARAGGVTAVHLSDDDGASFTQTHLIDVSPFSGGYGTRGGVELANGDILLPLSDVPHYRQVFVVHSRDDGETWSAPTLAATGEGHEFEEPATLVLRSGRIVMLLRDNVTRVLHSVVSDDGGDIWSPPRATGLLGYPAQMLALADGRIAAVVGQRRPPFGICLHVSADGERWDAPPLALVDDLPNKDLGYPAMAQRANGDLVVVYYAQDRDGVTGIDSVTVRLQ